MAQKRMFDKAIIETDNFLNVSLSAKALYFLFGMEADDEGFISPNRVLRLYGGEIGDVKNLIDVGLLIPFKSGVVVITHWNENNYLDKNRIKPTQYQKEKELLVLTDNKKYELNTCSTRGVERRGEEKSIEENSTVEIGGSISVKNLKYLKQIPSEDLEEFKNRFITTDKEIKSKAEDLHLYCERKGRSYKNYKAFLLNALKRDLKEKSDTSLSANKYQKYANS